MTQIWQSFYFVNRMEFNVSLKIILELVTDDLKFVILS